MHARSPYGFLKWNSEHSIYIWILSVHKFRHLKIISRCLGASPRDWEYEQENKENPIIVAGKIHKNLEFWTKTLKASKFVSTVIANGYSLPFVGTCPAFYAKNNASSLRNYDFVTKAIDELIKTKCVVQVDEIPYCCNPLTVAESQKLRLVLDLRHVNRYPSR